MTDRDAGMTLKGDGSRSPILHHKELVAGVQLGHLECHYDFVQPFLSVLGCWVYKVALNTFY